ncbi:hypothetical protein ACVIHI_007547 [Bradyrhizobium sp. USDA 4524]|nr:hypothetical protein [Bradyrhizobium sp. USDA 4538]MCP1900100.1 hypothetical protein [Bradyrhizobium sp. USDA 4537]MCP1994245.1 hypothetical protein [Bradyrhizobium sp. USDA 4539]
MIRKSAKRFFMLKQKPSAPKDVNDVLMQRVALAGNLAY